MKLEKAQVDLCPACKGSGRKYNEGSPLRYVWMDCPHCHGTGKRRVSDNTST